MLNYSETNRHSSECRLCEISRNGESNGEEYNTVLDESDRFLWIPGLGSFVEGYSLIISKNHVLNTGCLDTESHDDLELLLHRVISYYGRVFGQDLVIFEHGSMGNGSFAGSCIDHHHLHLVPRDISVLSTLRRDGFEDIKKLEGIRDLRHYCDEKRSYIYFRSAAGEHFSCRADSLPKQYLRQVVAEKCGCPEDWDWQERPFFENISRFVAAIKEVPDNDRK